MPRSTKPVKKPIFKNITTNDAFKLMEKHKNDTDLVILDVRTLEEFSEEHIEGAKNIDYYSPDFENQLDKLDKEKKYLIYCASGGRGKKAMKKMENLDFKQVYNIEGGYMLWCIKILKK
jgi:rhodanese-related sulfurtransferase